MNDLVQSSKFYADNRNEWGPGRRTVMRAFAGGVELSDGDIVIQHGMKRKTVSARRCELWRLGYVEPTGMKQQGRTRVQIWRATKTGERAIENLLGDEDTKA